VKYVVEYTDYGYIIVKSGEFTYEAVVRRGVYEDLGDALSYAKFFFDGAHVA